MDHIPFHGSANAPNARRCTAGFALIAGLVGAAGIAGCMASEQRALAAFERGDYHAARGLLTEERCLARAEGDAELDRCMARVVEIDSAIEHAVAHLRREARRLTIHRKDIQFNDYSEAQRYLRLARSLLPEGDPVRTSIDKTLAQIRDALSSHAEEYEDQIAKLESLLVDAHLEKELWNDVRWTFERLRILRLALRAEDRRLAPLARRFVEILSRAGDYQRAAVATDLARAVDDRTTGGQPESQLSDEDVLRFAFMHYRADKQKRERAAQLELLAEQLDEALRHEDLATAELRARESLSLDPDPKTTKRLRRLLQTLSDRIARATAHKAATAGPASTVPLRAILPSPTAIPVLGSHTAQLPAPSGKPEQPTDQQKEDILHETLQRLSEDFEQGRQFAAIVGLKTLAATLQGQTGERRALRLLRMWDPSRKRLIRENLDEAERLFVEMDEACLAYYKKVLLLDPPEDSRRRAQDRIETVERMLAVGGG